jgi:drug/metabolite transporter (DMT)-like permease
MVQLATALGSLLLMCLLDARHPSPAEALRDTWTATKSDVAGTLVILIVCFATVAMTLLIFLAGKYLDTTVFLVIRQLKTLTAAVFAVLIANRRISGLRWVSLFLLVIGVAVLQVRTRSIDNICEHGCYLVSDSFVTF